MATSERQPGTDEERELARVAKSDPGSTASREALGALLGRYEKAVYGLCYRMVREPELAAELAQETFYRAVKGFSGFDGQSRLKSWLLRIATNTCLTHFRRQKYRNHASLDAEYSDGDGRASRRAESVAQQREPEVGSRVLEDGERSERVLQALGHLAPEHRAVLLLRDAYGMEYGAIAEALGVAVGTIKSRLFRARAALRELVGAGHPMGLSDD